MSVNVYTVLILEVSLLPQKAEISNSLDQFGRWFQHSFLQTSKAIRQMHSSRRPQGASAPPVAASKLRFSCNLWRRNTKLAKLVCYLYVWIIWSMIQIIIPNNPSYILSQWSGLRFDGFWAAALQRRFRKIPTCLILLQVINPTKDVTSDRGLSGGR